MNSLLGYTESFSCNYYCRFCKASKSKMQEMTWADESLLRNVNNYEADLNMSNISLQV